MSSTPPHGAAAFTDERLATMPVVDAITGRWDDIPFMYAALCRVHRVPDAVRNAFWSAAEGPGMTLLGREHDVLFAIRGFYRILADSGVAPDTIPLADALCWILLGDFDPVGPVGTDAPSEYLTWQEITDHGFLYLAAGITANEAARTGLPSLDDAYTLAGLRGYALPAPDPQAVPT